ncbi:MAG: RNA polymerase sigma-70 factor (ECF subfamily) [Oleiphilaceae bacterium]|jgi:RNA polymerase sigma-70 factor (ECF subfamily)
MLSKRAVSNKKNQISLVDRPPLACTDDNLVKGVLISALLGDNENRNPSEISFGTKNNSHSMQRPYSAPSSDNASTLSVDQKLVVRVQKGDKKAFDMLVIKYQGKVASIISRYVKDHHEIADVSQEAFIKAYRALENFRGESAFYTWLYRIAINCAKNYLTSKGRRPPSADVDIDDAAYYSGNERLNDNATPESLLHKQQLEKVVNDAITALPEDLRVALTLREFDGLSYDEISEVMGCPVGTVRSRIFRARDAVDKEIHTLTRVS